MTDDSMKYVHRKLPVKTTLSLMPSVEMFSVGVEEEESVFTNTSCVLFFSEHFLGGIYHVEEPVFMMMLLIHL